jgi:hypothetical protein
MPFWQENQQEAADQELQLLRFQLDLVELELRQVVAVKAGVWDWVQASGIT